MLTSTRAQSLPVDQAPLTGGSTGLRAWAGSTHGLTASRKVVAPLPLSRRNLLTSELPRRRRTMHGGHAMQSMCEQASSTRRKRSSPRWRETAQGGRRSTGGDEIFRGGRRPETEEMRRCRRFRAVRANSFGEEEEGGAAELPVASDLRGAAQDGGMMWLHRRRVSVLCTGTTEGRGRAAGVRSG
jgi:hypothetical protein